MQLKPVLGQIGGSEALGDARLRKPFSKCVGLWLFSRLAARGRVVDPEDQRRLTSSGYGLEVLRFGRQKLKLIRCGEAVTDAGLGHQQPGHGGIGFDFLPNPRNIDAQIMGLIL